MKSRPNGAECKCTLQIFFDFVFNIPVAHRFMNRFLLLFTDRSTTKPKTFDPNWNEYFIHEVTNAKKIFLTVFHDAAIPPDDFIANCTIPFEDLAHRNKEQQDFWVCILATTQSILLSLQFIYLLIKQQNRRGAEIIFRA